jgi:hypothetical protein
MKTYFVTIDAQRITRVRVEAQDEDDAINLVENGEFEESQIVSVEDGFTEVRISE